jgi:hypothetical protein
MTKLNIYDPGIPKDKVDFDMFVELCKRMFERMERENSWPWEEEITENDQDLK